MSRCIEKQGDSREKGFVLVTALVLLAILTVLGVASAYKTVVEVKMSRVSADSVKALNAANAAVYKQFYEWAMDTTTGSSDGDRTEFATLISNVTGGTAVSIYRPTLLPSNIAALDSTASGDIDNYIQSNSFFRVYNVSSTGVSVTANSNWASATVTDPQVAIWVTSYNVPMAGGRPDPDKYPYVEPCGPSVGTACDGDSSIAIYAVARTGDTLRMVRQLVSTAVDPVLEGVNAITNAPRYRSWQHACSGVEPSGGGSATWSVGSDWNTIVDGTQALYEISSPTTNINDTPSGVAIASNSNASNSSTGGGSDTTTELVMSRAPLVAFSGHQPEEGVRVRSAGTGDLADGRHTILDTDTNSKLSHDLIPTSLLGTSREITYFLDGNSQLFNLNIFRWGAEQFTCQNETSTTDSDDGAYCVNAKELREAVDAAHTATVDKPVTGRLTLEEFEYNVSNAIPMFGLVRVMYPALRDANASSESCSVFNNQTFQPHSLDNGVTAVVGTGSNAIQPNVNASAGHNVRTIAPGNGRFTTYSSNSKIIVYGMLMFDYFYDADGDGYFDADSGTEYLLKPMEGFNIQHNINVPVIINPALPRITTGAEGRFPTAAAATAPSGSTDSLANAGLINSGSSTDPAGLASPYDGWFPASEGMLNVGAASGIEGTMALMNPDPTATGLLSAMREIEGATNEDTIGSQADSLYTGAKTRLEYYHALNKVTLSPNVDQYWPLSDNLPADLTSADSYFCIGNEDCGGSTTTGDNAGDRLHLLFPSGYTHGWKVALAALDMTAAEWNTLLAGNGGRSIVNLRTSHGTLDHPGGGTHTKGSPFSAADEGYEDSTNVPGYLAASSSYFSVTADTTTGYGRLDSSFRDVPSLIFSVGRIYLNSHLNMSGIVYTAGALEWAPGTIGTDTAYGLSYVTGAEVTGFGSYTRNYGTGSETYSYGNIAVAYDPVAVDYINTNQESVVVMRRYGWQELF